MKVAYFSPLPPSSSGIADYSALLLPALERLVEVEVVRPGRTRPIADADVALYHVGNNPDEHAWIVDALRRRPGVVVLHEFVIHHLVAGMTIGRRDGHAYLAAMEREAGVAGRMLGWGVLEGRVPPLWEIRPGSFPLAGEVLDRATGLIVHSRYVEALAREHGYDGPLWHIPHPAWPEPDLTPADVGGEPLVGCFGHLNESKRVPQLLRAFAAFRAEHPGARLLLVGAEAPGFDLRGRLERLGLGSALAEGGSVVREPYVEEERLWSLLAACDACVLLRSPTMGETSGSAIRALSLGKPLVVGDLGWFAELPDEVALKVAPGGDEEVAEIARALATLAEPGVAGRMGAAARAYVRAEHDLDRVAERYAAALEEAAGGAAADARVLQAVAAAAADTGVAPDVLAPELAEVGLAETAAVPAPASVATASWRAVPVWAWLGGLYAVAAAVQLALAVRVVSPWIMVDELVYSDMARSFADTGRFLLRGGSANYGFVYPLLLSPVYKALGPLVDVYPWLRVVNVLVMCSVILPAYLLARRVVRPGYAFAAAALAVSIPPVVYTGTLMTENAFYPIFVWLAYALVLALERPTLRRQVVVLVVCALAFLTRAQAVALVVAALTAPLLLAWIERGRPSRLRAWKPLYGVVAAGVVAALAVELARGRSPSAILGGYSVTTSGGKYHAWPALRWIVYHFAYLDLALWVLPFAALVVLVANARHLDAPLRAFCAAAATLTVWLTLEVGLFASTFSQRIEERNLFYVAPLLLVALLAWIERGQPRPPRAVVAAAGVAAALPGVLPFVGLMNVNAQSDTPFLLTWWYLGDRLVGDANVQLVAVGVAVALGAAFLWLPRRYAPLLPALVAAGFLLNWLPLELWVHSFPTLSAYAYETGLDSAPRGWIDQTVGANADVTIVWTGENPYRGWENEFWNRSVRHVVDLGTDTPLMAGAREPQLHQEKGLLVDANGKPVQVQYVLADGSTLIEGTPVGTLQPAGMTLYRVDGALRTRATITGWFPDRWIGKSAVWERPSCTGGTLRIPVRSDGGLFAGVTQQVAVSGTTAPAQVSLRPGALRTIVVPLQPRAGTCRVRLDVTPTRRPSDFPALQNPDTRTLGVLVDGFFYTP